MVILILLQREPLSYNPRSFPNDQIREPLTDQRLEVTMIVKTN